MRWLGNWQGKKTPASFHEARRRATFRPTVEALESRQLLAVIALATPAPISPKGAIASPEPAFTWNAVSGADHYDVWVDDQTAAQAVLRNPGAVGSSWVPTTP